MVFIKVDPADFEVKELINLKIDGGKYLYCKLIKRDYSTIKAIEILSHKLKIPMKSFGWAGNKDRRALTEQVISIANVSRRKIETRRIGK